MHPDDLIERHFRLIPAQKAALKRLKLGTIRNLLYHFPSRYEAAGTSGEAARLIPGTKVTLIGSLSGLKPRKLWKSKRNVTEGWFEDTSGRVKVMWFNQPYIASYLPKAGTVKISGTVGGNVERPYIANPEVEVMPAGVATEGLFSDTNNPKSEVRSSVFAVYPESRGVTSKWFYHALERVFARPVRNRAHAQARPEGALGRAISNGASNVLQVLDDPIPKEVRERYHLPDLARSLLAMHKPKNQRETEAARKRFAFEEIFALQLTRAQERAENDAQASFPITDSEEHAERFLETIPFPPTKAQKRAIADILADFGRSHPMARLLEGDVGSGKTLVAAATAYAVVNSRPPLKLASGEFARLPDGSVANRTSGTLQVAYMAPTEILAGQHFQSFIEYFSHLPINIALLTGKVCKKFPSKVSRGEATNISRAQLLKWVENGEIAMIVGTHALIQKSVAFQHLAYVIVDEQHRFGTRQRRALAHKGDASPHFLSMTATPIPRTLSLTIYGDLDISLLDELPPGRVMVKTAIVKSGERDIAYEAVRRELSQGRQAYIICPRIEEPDPSKWNALQAKSVKTEAKRLKKEVFQEFEIGLLHGAMKPKEKDDAMSRFTSGETQILVATSVVEVGVNVPNATIILIEGAERFGLAQLHQLRGRVQRSAHTPFCFLLPETSGAAAAKRLRALEKTNDGFKLAEADLEARGAGDLYGRQQWGVTDLGMEALKNVKLIRAAREEAERLIQTDVTLSTYPTLRERVERASAESHRE